ncbi:MAG: autotransporter-associated beta strand repeat-containing protein [Phycisphaerae bacterium]
MRHRIPLLLAFAASAAASLHSARAASPILVHNQAGFEGLEEASVLYYPASNTFVTDSPNFPNHLDEGGGMFRDILRNYYPTLGWWDGDRDTTNTDRQRTEAKGITGLGHQGLDQTFEYSFDFRTNPGFTATSSFDHIFQLKALNGDNGPPLATISLYKNGSGIQGRVDSWSDGTTGTPQKESVITTFNYTAGQWIHFVIRITPCAQGETTGGIQLSVNGGAFVGVTNSAIDLQGATSYRPKFGFYRGISTTNGVPVGDSWVEHRTVTGYIGDSNVLSWKGGANNNTWDTASTANFLNGATPAMFNTIDQVNFTATTNTTINLAGDLWPDFTYVNSSANYTFQGAGSITGGSLRKEGAGNLTIATSNAYPGLTDIRSGTLFVSGSLGDNTLVSLTGGTLKLGAANALGANNTAATNGTQINGGTLDLNGFGVGSEPLSVQGTGLSGNGAIISSGAAQISALSNLTLTGDATLGGSARWDLRGAGATLSTNGNPFNLTKTGANQISFVGAAIDPALANITINNGILAFQTAASSLGDPSKTLTLAVTGTLNLYNTTNTLTKQFTLNGGTIWAESGNASQNNIDGNITLSSLGGTFDAGSPLSGGTPNPNANLHIAAKISAPSGTLIKTGPGTLTLSNPNNALSALTLNAGTLNLPNPTKLTSLTLAGSPDNWTPTLSISTLVVQTTSQNKSTTLATLQDQITYATAHPTGIDFLTPLPANEALALIDNASLPTPLTTYAGLALDANSLLLTPLLLGDTNADGKVDLSDLSTLLNHFGQSTSSWTAGNFDNANTIDLTDLSDILNNFGLTTLSNSSELPFTNYQLPVPEPASTLLLTPALLLVRRQRRPR